MSLSYILFRILSAPPVIFPHLVNVDVLNATYGCEVSFYFPAKIVAFCLADHLLTTLLLHDHDWLAMLWTAILLLHSHIALEAGSFLACLLASFSSVPPFREHILMKAVTGSSLKPSLCQYPIILDHLLHYYLLGDGAFLLTVYLFGACRSSVYNNMSPSNH